MLSCRLKWACTSHNDWSYDGRHENQKNKEVSNVSLRQLCCQLWYVVTQQHSTSLLECIHGHMHVNTVQWSCISTGNALYVHDVTRCVNTRQMCTRMPDPSLQSVLTIAISFACSIVPFRSEAMQGTMDQVGNVVGTSVVESGNATWMKGNNASTIWWCHGLDSLPVITASMGRRPCGLARQASKAHGRGVLVMAHMCNVVWHQHLSMALLLEVVGVS